METTWAVPLISALVTILGLYLAKPERPKVAWVTVTLVLIVAAWQSFEEYGRLQAQHVLQARLVDRLSAQTRAYLNTLSTMLVSASDGWLPVSPQDFFSRRTADLLCTQLNVDEKAPVEPSVLYDKWLAIESEQFVDVIRKSLIESMGQLDAELTKVLVGVERSELLTIGADRHKIRRFDQSHHLEVRPPVLCWGLEPLIVDSLLKLQEFYKVLIVEEKRYGVERRNDWLDFPPHYKSRYLGKARFTTDQFSAWRQAHPGSPGPARFGKGNPNKSPILDPRSGS